MRFPFLVGALAFAVTAGAQSIVFPSDHATVQNGASYLTWWPFSDQAPNRSQIVYDGWDIGLTAGTPITRIGFRQDGSTTSASQQVVMEVLMCTTSAASDTLSSSFDSNYVGTPTVVFPQQVFVLPAFGSATTGAMLWIDLPAPHYVYQGGNLLIEFRISLNSNGNQGFSYRLDRARFISTVTAGVNGCQHTGGGTPTLHSNAAKVGGNWSFSLSNAPANTPIALFIAPGQQMVTPYSLSVLGVDPSCQGQLPLTNYASFSATTASNGYKAWTVPVPNLLVFNDVYMTSQVIAFDYFAQGQLVTSNADEIQFGIDPGWSILHATGSTTATTGYVYTNYGLVTFFN